MEAMESSAGHSAPSLTAGSPSAVSSSSPLITALYATVYKFDFHQVVRLLEATTPGCVPLGEGTDVSQEALRITSVVDFIAPRSDVQSLLPANTRLPLEALPKLAVNFMGIAGIAKPLPTPLSYRIYQRVRQKDKAALDFLDLFNHRFNSILYRIHKKHRLELAQTSIETTPLGRALGAFLGVSPYVPSLQYRLSVPDQSLFAYSGYFWTRPHSALGLKKIVRHHFNVPTEVREFQGSWIKAEPHLWSRMTTAHTTYNTLGRDAVLGTKAWDQMVGLEVVLGPLAYDDYLTFLPNGRRYQPLCDLMRLYLSNLRTIKIRFRVTHGSIGFCTLGKARLGYTSWAHAMPLSQDSDHVVIPCNALH